MPRQVTPAGAEDREDQMSQVSTDGLRARRQRLLLLALCLVLGLLVGLAVVQWWEHAT